jgi:alginate O-acetyltransferase complex protein AlgI
MNFTEIVFLPFLGLVLASQALLRTHRQRVVALLIASYVFYGWWDPVFLVLILFTSLSDWWFAMRIADEPRARVQKRWIIASLVTNLGVLAIFKYAAFAVRTLNDAALALGASAAPFGELTIPLPVGISFYTFQSLSYTIDVYRGQLKPERRLDYFLLFVTAFPQLVAGPIVRAVDFLPQLQTDFRERRDPSGIFLVLYGLAKKLFLADTLAVFVVDPTFNAPRDASPLQLLLAAYAYAFQIFLDFSAYSDIAIGLGKLLGLDFMKNFNAPYLAESLGDFWRRWHISLSTWFRDYLYYPLGGNRGTRRQWLIASLAVFLLSGLWHGANLTFIVWGAIHAFVFVSERLFLPRGGPRPLRLLITFHVVTAAWIFFRSPTIAGALDYFAGFAGDAAGTPVAPVVLVALGAAVLLHGLVEPRIERVTAAFARAPMFLQASTAMALGVAAFATLDSALAHQAFIYFQF